MSSLFKKRLSCFYCGRRSAQSQPGPIRQWQCQQCLAVNYLDENGEITDPPISEASSGTRYTQYAQPLPRASSPDLAPDSSIFCSTCLKNQHLLTHTLASYLPPPSHPDYNAYEASYPAYRKSLEERYPQVCENCEPRVRNRIQQAGYAAKSDHLRRMMEKSRGGRSNRRARSWGWRSMLVSTGAVSFWASVAGQLTWNLMGALAAGNTVENIEADLSLSSVPFCFNRIWERQPVFDGCSLVLTPYAGLALFLGILSIWWNPMLRHKVEGRGGRLTGMSEYYKVQIIVLVVRFVAWACLQDPSITGLNPRLAPAIHAFMAIFTVVSVVMSRYVIKFDTTPLVSWQNNNVEPLVSQKPKERHQVQSQLASHPSSRISLRNSEASLQRFPVNSLAPAPAPAEAPSYIPPSPQTDIVDDADAMDWTPSQQSLQISVNPKPVSRPAPSGPLPFQGQLPPVPKPPAWQLRNPVPEQPVLKAPEHKPNPFHNAPVLQPKLTASQESRVTPTDNFMAPPKFFPPSDFATDTGLESLFDKAFSIRDDPVDVQKHGWNLRSSKLHAATANSTARSSRILKWVLLGLSVSILLAAQVFQLPGNSVETAVIGISFLVAGFSLLESLMRPLAAWSAVDIILSVIELVACVYLATYPSQGGYDSYKLDRAGKCLVAFMAGQEMIALGSLPARKTGPKNSTTDQPSQDREPPQPSQQTNQRQVQKYQEPHKTEPNPPSFTSKQSFSSSIQPDINPRSGVGARGITNNNNNNRLRNNFNYPTQNTQNSPITHHSPTINHLPSIHNDPTATHPAPFSSILRPHPPPTSPFSSFNSALPDSLRLSPPPSATTTTASMSYASSTASDPPTPPQKYASLPAVSPGRRMPSSGIGGLSLEDDPWPQRQRQAKSQAQTQQQQQPRSTRYSLRARKG
ncbi:hypothetical protein AJ79_07202 [Helicocarpus griseus UAMH5409]|uniref:Ima1 N-terminal domain-containing protein n=1 Tax=Helicocarpus griseus UAMH5409 TaxID=1447875 RepID=A0A2B7X5U5_9EURO|nr:hypothetical protein AJ79_07202 [Helicocarpus griseus UAMH5409]